MTRPPRMSGYDDDFFAWTQEQAVALRHLPASVAGAEVDVANLDIANLAMEIEDLGRRDLREVKSFLKLVIEHLIKIYACPGYPDVPHWRSETRHFQDSAIAALSPSMRQLLSAATVWQSGWKAARGFLADAGVCSALPTTCPFTLDDLLSNDFDLDTALAKLATANADISA